MDIIILPDEMFNDLKNINCYNLFVYTNQGEQMWDVDRFVKRFPRLGKLVHNNFTKDIKSFDVKGIINITLG